jgi:hypothetical protein
MEKIDTFIIKDVVNVDELPFAYPLDYSYSQYLYYTSFLIGASSLVSLYYGDYVTFLFMFILFLSSIKFWRKPDYGFIRNLDMFICKCVIVYFFLNSCIYQDEISRGMIVISILNGIIFYICEIICYFIKSAKWIIFHMGLHIHLSFVTPFVLYIL